MGVEEDVMEISSQLEKITAKEKDPGQALDLLKNLSKLKVNLAILSSTRIGMTVNALR